MKLILNAYKRHKNMSEETDCFEANIMLDGKKVGFIKNEGTGGSNSIHWFDREKGRMIERWAAVQKTEFDFEKLDELIDNLRVAMEEQKDVARWCKTKAVIRLKDAPKGQYVQFKEAMTPALRDWIVKKYAGQIEEICNDRPNTPLSLEVTDVPKAIQSEVGA